MAQDAARDALKPGSVLAIRRYTTAAGLVVVTARWNKRDSVMGIEWTLANRTVTIDEVRAVIAARVADVAGAVA